VRILEVVRVYWTDATGQGREDFCKLPELVAKLSAVESEHGTLVSISATHHNGQSPALSRPYPQRS
jgi:hypothetical protein